MSKQKHSKLPRSFYERPTLEVAPEILGKYVVYHSRKGKLSAKIVEVEAYVGQDDPACHAARGLTKRNRPMFGPGGFTYIYFVYGMYYCLNFVTEPEGMPAALLLRAAEPDEGNDVMMKMLKAKKGTSAQSLLNRSRLLSGPGKFCRSFGLTVGQSGLDLTGDTIYVEDRNVRVDRIKRSQRIGIKVGTDHLWRFFDSDSKALSRSE